jgi:hypothetical protein
VNDFAAVERQNSPVAEADLAANPERMAAWESLRSRIETLEQQVEALMVSSRARSPLLPERVEDSSPATTGLLHDGPAAETAGSATANSPGSESVPKSPGVEDNAKSEPQAARARERAGEAALRVVAGDRAAWQIANTLSGVLVNVGWTVGVIVEDAALSRGSRGLTLSIGSAVPIRRVTRTLEALREAGYGLTFQIDPEDLSDEALLIVGVGSGPEK